ncbi:HTH-type transcriptional regulator PuuR [bioreactor metagenome]|uniref:HTH-type transcriptional regulator PuuR n=1 Tax=bioreactor metagenome TaxID=1076179 RepID=A0A645D5X0_9ZZZZ|nr:cupin domain-containing protein [Candidatus Pelethousia sp.]
MHIELGQKIRELRKKENMSISELAKAAELSVGIISQIERNLVSPSIVSLWKIAKCLNVSVGYFFEEETDEAMDPVVRREQRKRIFASNNKAVYELLSKDLKDKKIEFLYITIDPGEDNTPQFVTHDGEECGVVIKGRMMVKTQSREYYLEEGDSIYFSSTIPHKYVNVGDEPCISIWAMTPPNF